MVTILAMVLSVEKSLAELLLYELSMKVPPQIVFPSLSNGSMRISLLSTKVI